MRYSDVRQHYTNIPTESRIEQDKWGTYTISVWSDQARMEWRGVEESQASRVLAKLRSQVENSSRRGVTKLTRGEK